MKWIAAGLLFALVGEGKAAPDCDVLPARYLPSVSVAHTQALPQGCRFEGLSFSAPDGLQTIDAVEVFGDIAALLPTGGAARRLPDAVAVRIENGFLPPPITAWATESVAEISLERLSNGDYQASGTLRHRDSDGPARLDWAFEVQGLSLDLGPWWLAPLRVTRGHVSATFDGVFTFPAPSFPTRDGSRVPMSWPDLRQAAPSVLQVPEGPLATGDTEALLAFLEAMPTPTGTLTIRWGGAGFAAIQLVSAVNGGAGPDLLRRAVRATDLQVSWQPVPR